ncbi:ATP-dependent RNA helicase HrpA [Nocardia bovistercoris]|uniref:ATP-dependent RNA helicase HrpA n=1 Tax=Nocardia bovistercoris TaxID=2785916 RepID=UPI001E571CE2|nr:ATP-dependent RNA helicase HrpA [Nocardia bovistercoris]
MTRTADSATRELRTRLANLTLRDEYRLRRRLDRARGAELAEITAEIDAAELRVERRRAAVPRITYPEQLPVTQRRGDIAEAIAAHQVVIVAGETGSGKTTQIPKICLELGRGIRGAIGHTQPRRLAARTVAERIAEELSTELGDVIGYTVRFTDQASERTLVKLMTDGILLAEIQRDRLLRRYDTIIIDEAHERSLNIDFLLGYLKQLLPRRPDLKVIITSATIDPELFARHFADDRGEPAPIVEVSGRSYPVEVRYRPLALEVPAAAEDDDEDTRIVDRDPVDAIGDAVRELFAEGDGDVLVFLSGEREIRDTADALRDLRLPRTEIVPLYARLSAAEQHRVFQPHTGRRVVLATNVAETSLTVPGIRYVVDPGTARISRYSMRTKVQRLPIEEISQASARQRSGRCGRVADGIAVRLYSEDDFEARPAFTEPEILRTNLAAVILQMTALGLGDIERFPFVEPPDKRAIRDGIALLEELGALVRHIDRRGGSASDGAAKPEGVSKSNSENVTTSSIGADDASLAPDTAFVAAARAASNATTDTASNSESGATSNAEGKAVSNDATPSIPETAVSSNTVAVTASNDTAHTTSNSSAVSEVETRSSPDTAGEKAPASRRSAPQDALTLTATGREMAQIPVDPRMSRMLVQAHRTGCLADVLIIVAALSIQDVRERPAEFQQAADTKHARFVMDGSDFLAYLRLWEYLTEQRKSLSSNQFRRMCRDEFLHYLRIREWQDLHGQLRTITRGLGWSTDAAALGREGDTSPRRDGDTSSRRDGDTSPRRDGDTSPRRDGDTSPRRDGDTSPRRDGDTSPRRDGDTSPRRDGDTSPRRDGDTSPRRDGDTSPRRDGDTSPRRGDGTSPQRGEDTFSQSGDGNARHDGDTAGGANDSGQGARTRGRRGRGRAPDARRSGDATPRTERASTNTPAESDGDTWDSISIHQALLAGMLSHIGVREAESREFLGARNAKFMIFPGSSLAKKPPRWVMAAELVETSRLWGRMAARVEPEWAERLAGDLVKRTYSEPHWSSKRGAARAYERVTLYGIPLVTGRAVDYGRIDPELSRELFLRHALVQGEWQTRHEFFHRNRALLDDVADLEHRARRRDILVDDEVLFEFYDRRVPADIVSVRHFDTWWRRAARTDPALLDFSKSTVVNASATGLDPTAFPDAWRQGELSFPLSYQFEPGQADDGVTVAIPIEQLAHVRPVGFDWLVPGMREELAAAYIKTLPKSLRRAVVPAPDFAAAALAALTPRSEPLRVGLARELSRLGSITVTPADLDPAALPDHLRVTFAAVTADGSVTAKSKDLAALKTQLAEQVSKSVARATAGAERAPTAVWTSESLGTLPSTVRREVAGQTVTGYPALVPETDGVAVRVLSSPAEQAAAMRAGTRALVLAALPTSVRAVTASLPPRDRLSLSQNPYGTVDALVEDCRAAAADELVAAAGGPVRDPAAFDRLVAAIRPDFTSAVARSVRAAVPVLAGAQRVATALADTSERDIAEDVRRQLDDLVFPGFLSEWGGARLRELPRYLDAAVLRLESLPGSATRDRQGMVEVDRVLAAYGRLLEALPEHRRHAPDVAEIWWMIEEFRVSLFAQKLGTPYPISAKRIEKAIAAVKR